MSQFHSTGRGGAGNIGVDSNEYTDGSIVREGPVGESGSGAEFSTGRGGAGNIGDTPSSHPGPQRLDDEVIPETATRDDPKGEYANFHTGRGGQGNIYKEEFNGHSTKKEQEEAERRESVKGGQKASVSEKVKKALGVDKGERSSVTPEREG